MHPSVTRDSDKINEKFSMIDNKYRKQHLISSGTQGKVFLVSRNKKLFAAKIFAWQVDFRGEMAINQMVKNVPGVLAVQYHAIDAKILNDDGSVSIKPVSIMQLAEKGDMFQFYAKIRQHHQLKGKNYLFPINICKAIFYELLKRVQSLHEAKILHRDLKPQNIVIDENYHIRLADFGAAVKQDIEIKEIRAGSPGYIAPEVLYSQYVGPESDLFSCGVIFYALCFWAPPIKQSKDRIVQNKFQNAENVEKLQPIWKALKKRRNDDNEVELQMKQFFLRTFKKKEFRPTIQEILSSNMMSTRATYQQMRHEMHTQYKLFEDSDILAKKIAGLKAQFEAELRQALVIRQQQQMQPENTGQRSANHAEYSQFYIDLKYFEKKGQIQPLKLSIDLEDASCFTCSPAAALAWIRTYFLKAVKNKQLSVFHCLDQDCEVSFHFQGEGSKVLLELIFIQKDAPENLFVQIQGELFENNKGNKFRINWKKKQGCDFYVSALLMDLKQCISALITQPQTEKLAHQELTSQMIKSVV